MNYPIKINGTDVSSIFSITSLKTTRLKILGDNGGYMLDGTTVEDVLAFKSQTTISFVPLTEQAQTAFFRNLYSKKYAQFEFFDVYQGTVRNIECIYSEPTAAFLLTGVDGNDYWNAGSLTLTER